MLGTIPYKIPTLRLFVRPIVNSEVTRNGKTFHVRAGIKGQCDLYGIVEGGGHIELELKAAKGRLSPEQETWMALMRRMGVPCLVLKSEKDETPEETVNRWISEIAACLNVRSK